MLLVDDLAAGGTKNLRHTPRGLVTLLLGKTDMVLGKRWLFSIGNGAEIRPLEKGRKCPDLSRYLA